MGLISTLPWWIKLIAKLILTRIPISYGTWRKLRLFRHGDMNDPLCAIRTFQKYYQQALKHRGIQKDFNVLELGPGDSILTGIVARSMGARKVWLVDAGAFADTDIGTIHRTIKLLGEKNLDPNLEGVENFTELTTLANINYLTNGTKSLERIPDNSIDFFWSQAVLEHVPLEEFNKLLHQLRRTVKADGIGLHAVDFRDHLGNSLNSLRFSVEIWESHVFKTSGFYTNRIRPAAMAKMFEEAGFSVNVLSETQWPKIPTAREAMAAEFRHLPEKELLINECVFILYPK